MAESEGVVKPAEFETTAFGREELKEKDWGAGVSSAENLHEDKRFFYIYFTDKKLSVSAGIVRWMKRFDRTIYLSFRFSFTVGGEGAARL